MTMPSDVAVIDTMIGFPRGDMRELRLHHGGRPRTGSPRRTSSSRPSTCSRTCPTRPATAASTRSGSPCGEMDKLGHREGPRRRATPTGHGRAARELSRPLHRLGARGPQRRHGRRARHRASCHESGASGPSAFPAGTFPQVPINDKQMYPGLRQVRRAGHRRVRVRRHPRARGCRCVPSTSSSSTRSASTSPSWVRHPARLRALDRPRRQAAAQVAEPLLLDQRLRPEVLPEGDHRLRRHAGRRQDHLRRLLPDGLSLERIVAELPDVPFKDEVWPKFLRHNAARVLGLDA